MAEKSVREAQFAYVTNAALVIEPERDKSKRDEPSGEAESIYGRITGRMGDRAVVDSHDYLERKEKLEKKRAIQAVEVEDELHSSKRRRNEMDKDADILAEASYIDINVYKPKTPETRLIYERLLDFIIKKVGDYSQDVLRDVADQLIQIVKNPENSSSKKSESEEILGKMDESEANKLFSMISSINDYDQSNSNNTEDNGEGDHIYTINADDEEDNNEEDQPDEIVTDSEESESEGEDNAVVETVHNAEDKNDEETSTVDIKTIDSFWLQREIGKFTEDPNIAQSLSEQTLQALQIEDDAKCEEELIEILGLENFDFIKQLSQNRSVLSYVIRYRQATSEEVKKSLEEEMKKDTAHQGPEILSQLNKTINVSDWAEDRKTEFDKKTKMEAKKLTKMEVSTSKSQGNDLETEEGSFHANASDNSVPKPQHLLNLQQLEFTQGGHYMSNISFKLPEKSWKAEKKGYEEVHVPAIERKQFAEDTLVKIKSLPDWAQPAFKGMDRLNPVQSKIYETALLSSENILLCAPTGAGKTNVAVLTIMHEIGLHLREDGSVDKDKFKIVYVAPMKALVKEIVDNFTQRLSYYGIVVRELSGDINLTKEEISETQIIVTTPEKWDIITRKSGERTYTQLVRLIIIDEIHLLHDDRGPVLEAIVARTLRQIETTQELVRLVGLSATLPNYVDVANFLRVTEKGLFFFDNSYRPVGLDQQYIGVTEKKPLKALQLMNKICYEKVLAEAGKNQVIIFVHSRKETAKTARAIRDMSLDEDTLGQFVPENSGEKELLKEQSKNCKDKELQELLPFGFAIHHAGLTRDDRSLVEDLFAARRIPVLVSTMTLAWGVNLPAHTVIIKGTQMYSPEKGQWVELSPQDVLQMLGRAGRPQYDKTGEGIIITKHSELQYYLSLMNQQLPIESQHIKKLADNLNAEIVIGTCQNVSEAVHWLGYTYLFIRMLRNPELYGVDPDELVHDPILLQRRVDLVHSAATLLAKHGLIKYERKTGVFQSTALGRTAAYYYITNPSIATYNEFLKPTMGDIEIFRLFSLSNEFSQIIVRQEEKLELEKLLQKVPIPIRETVEEPSAKVNVLLQAYISKQKLDGFALAADMVFVQQSAGRIFRALFEICLKRGWSAVSQKILNICKCVDKRLWYSQSPLRQFKGRLSEQTLNLLENNPLPFERYYDITPSDFGEMVRNSKLSSEVHSLVHMIPRMDCQIQVQPITRSLMKVELLLTADFKYDEQYHGNSEGFHIIVEDGDGEQILHYEYFLLKKKYFENEHSLVFTVPIFDPLSPQYFLRIINDKWLHSETIHTISFRHLLLPEKYHPNVELLDLTPLPVYALKNKEFESLYNDRFIHFNPIQTQVFDSIYKTDNNTLICAPTGSGKTIAAELAILKHIADEDTGKILYIAPIQDLCILRYNDWKKFEQFGLVVSLLMGDMSIDESSVAKSNLIITNPEIWDRISRRWKQKQSIQSISLVIADELHMINSPKGYIYEIVLSRIRYMTNQLEKKVRIIALSTSVANARSLSDWLTCERSLYNFHSSVRPVPLEMHIEGFDINHVGTRLLAMSKPMYNSIISLATIKSTIVFVPSKKQAQMTSVDILTYASASNNASRFLHTTKEDIEQITESIQDPALKVVLLAGIGFFYKGMNENDKKIVLQLYHEEKIQVLVSTFDCCWCLEELAHLVIIMETTYYDGKEHMYVDYSINEMIQMIGHASRPSVDSVGKCVVLCHTPKKAFFKKFLYEPLPLESQLYLNLADLFNAEIVSRSIDNYQDANDYLTWTFLFRRLLKNPNYYGLQGVSADHLSDYTSELTEETINSLVDAGLIKKMNELELTAVNMGMIAAYYYVQYTTIELFAQSIKPKAKRKGLLQILCSASEFDDIIIRHNEQDTIRQDIRSLPYPVENKTLTGQKVNLLLQNYFSRKLMSSDMKLDTEGVLSVSLRLLQCLVDIISSSSYLKPVLATIELCQMIVQGMWAEDSRLLQLPHFDKDRAQDCEAEGVEGIFDIIECEDEQRNQYLKGLTEQQIGDIATFCNSYPSIELEHEIEDIDTLTTDDVVTVNVHLTRDVDEDEDPSSIGIVSSQTYPIPKKEMWWLIVGDNESNEYTLEFDVKKGMEEEEEQSNDEEVDSNKDIDMKE
ncbi:hypothetical protein WA158_004920 [Blastocystis sp. Blastoise]